MPADVDNLPVGTEVGYYRVVRRIAAGGFGTLYEVERDGKSYALKIAHDRLGSLNPTERARFEHRTDREVASLKQLSHPLIVKVFALDRYPDLEDGHPYLVMEFVRGDELRRFCRERAPSPAVVCALFEKLARAVHYMHEREVFHRDLKSENVLVRPNGDPVIIDFGISRGRGSFRVTRHEGMVGTATHYAPEYVHHRETEAYEHGQEFQWTAATDLHAVGYMLYEALTGEPPFQSEDEIELWRRIKEDVPPRPSEVHSAVPKLLDRVVLKLLAKEPKDRYQSGLELAEALHSLLERHATKPQWSRPLPRPETSSKPPEGATRSTEHPNIEDIDELRASPIALAAAKLAEQVPENGPPTPADAQPRASSASSTKEPLPAEPEPPVASSSVERIRRELLRALAPRTRFPRPVALACAATALFFVAGAVVAASRRAGPPRPTSLMARVSREPPPEEAPALAVARRHTATESPAIPSSAPSVADARAIDRELEARYGGRPTVTPDGALVNLPSSRSATSDVDPASKAETEKKPTPAIGENPLLLSTSAAPAWLKRSTNLQEKMLVAQVPALPPKPLGIPTGTHVPVRLLTSLDSRTVGDGPAEARLPRPLVLRGEVVLPAGTLAFGKASAAQGRFVVHFERLRLPDDREFEIAAIAFDRDDDKPGLAPSRGVPGRSPSTSAGRGMAIARTSAETVLGTISGGLAEDLVRGAGQTAIQPVEPAQSGTAEVEVLDPGLLFDLWVERPF